MKQGLIRFVFVAAALGSTSSFACGDLCSMDYMGGYDMMSLGSGLSSLGSYYGYDGSSSYGGACGTFSSACYSGYDSASLGSVTTTTIDIETIYSTNRNTCLTCNNMNYPYWDPKYSDPYYTPRIDDYLARDPYNPYTNPFLQPSPPMYGEIPRMPPVMPPVYPPVPPVYPPVPPPFPPVPPPYIPPVPPLPPYGTCDNITVPCPPGPITRTAPVGYPRVDGGVTRAPYAPTIFDTTHTTPVYVPTGTGSVSPSQQYVPTPRQPVQIPRG